ncbi:hypothetical protein [Paenibacillus polymyxa]|uniref:hypothetical protein n=1 Tax=Paenibacillus polymyxa TaxID=1406 RepID=UPI0018AD3C58|nr:hypothetical protein [Paenibacillus polymyxa]
MSDLTMLLHSPDPERVLRALRQPPTRQGHTDNVASALLLPELSRHPGVPMARLRAEGKQTDIK